jgi:N-methylhydantoinase B/oxoprolinase/acetone carboxylase alpha subunit
VTALIDSIDPIVTSVIQHRLLAIVEEMGEAMLRTSYSQILNSSRDFSTAICDLDGRLIAQAEHVPIHVGALPFAAQAVTAFFGDDIHQGDVFLLNDPYHGGNHLPDLTAFVPVRGRQWRWAAALLVDQPCASERHRRGDARRLQRRRDRDLAGRPPHHAA